MVKDFCWEVSEAVIPDLPAWLTTALKSQLPGHKAGGAGPPGSEWSREGPGLFIAMLQGNLPVGPLPSFSHQVAEGSFTPEQKGSCVPSLIRDAAARLAQGAGSCAFPAAAWS